MEPIYAALVRNNWLPAPSATTGRPAAEMAQLFKTSTNTWGLAAGDPRSFPATMRQQLGDSTRPGPGTTASARWTGGSTGQRRGPTTPGHCRPRLVSSLPIARDSGSMATWAFNEPPCLASAACRCLRTSGRGAPVEQNSADFGGDYNGRAPALRSPWALPRSFRPSAIVLSCQLVAQGQDPAPSCSKDPPDTSLCRPVGSKAPSRR